MNVHDYLIDHAGFDWPRLLSDWAWLLPRELTVWLMNRFGDLILVFPDGTVHFLDVGVGTLERVADSREDFCRKIDEGDNANQWLMIPLVDELVAAGLRLQPGRCYCFKRPPVLGGEYAVDNAALLPIAEHYGFLGSLHGQLKDVPDGGQVELVWTE
jgi:hypothetical protein